MSLFASKGESYESPRTCVDLRCHAGLCHARQRHEAALENLPCADFRPGQLRLPLVVAERSGVPRHQAVVTSGVPFPPGFLPDVAKLAVVDENGRPVASQATVMVKWHRPAYDDSAQWVLVSFAADVPANGTSTYYLTDSGKAAGARRRG